MDLSKMIKNREVEQQESQPDGQRLPKEEYAAMKKAEREELWARVDAQAQEVFRDDTAMKGFLPVGENGAYPWDDIQEGFSKTLEHMTWKDRFSISREMMDDAKLIDFRQRPEHSPLHQTNATLSRMPTLKRKGSWSCSTWIRRRLFMWTRHCNTISPACMRNWKTPGLPD